MLLDEEETEPAGNYNKSAVLRKLTLFRSSTSRANASEDTLSVTFAKMYHAQTAMSAANRYARSTPAAAEIAAKFRAPIATATAGITIPHTGMCTASRTMDISHHKRIATSPDGSTTTDCYMPYCMA